MADEEKKSRKECLFDAQDHFQLAKRHLEKANKCLGSGLSADDITLDQAKCILEGRVAMRALQLGADETHCTLQELWEKIDEAEAEEATRRR